MKTIYLGLILFCGLQLPAQSLFNASMEGEPIDATMPDGWHACQKGTTPDILPGVWGVETEPYEGDSYVGLITRPNGTWESIGQRFSKPLEAGSCYFMQIIAAHSDTYTGYNNSGRMRVWLGESKCDLDELILDVPSLMHTEWKNYPIQINTYREYNYLIIECYHPLDKTASKGNILIDRITAPTSCERS